MKDKIMGILIECLKGIFTGVVKSSYVICLATAMLAVIFYVCGCKKAGKYVSVSIVVYVLLQALKGAIE